MKMERAWDALPSLALVNIFCRTSFTDRTQNAPLVCRSWAHASQDPRCWSSMVASSEVEHTFIRARKPYLDQLESVVGVSGIPQPNDSRLGLSRLGLSRLRTLIRRSRHGAAGITSLFLFPFVTGHNDDDVIRLIARRCPNLNHLSLYRSYHASEEAILELIRSCKNLELVDFADSPNFSPSVLEELGRCCPDIRGIRRNGDIKPSAISSLVTNIPGLKLLNLSDSPIREYDLLTIIVSGCSRLKYLDVRGCGKHKSEFIQRVSTRIPEFFCDSDIDFVVPQVIYLPLNEYGGSSHPCDNEEGEEEDDDDESCDCADDDNDCEDLSDYDDYSCDDTDDDHDCEDSSDDDDCGGAYGGDYDSDYYGGGGGYCDDDDDDSSYYYY